MRIEKVSCELQGYEIGKSGVAKIELTGHGSEVTHIYKIQGVEGELILHAGFIQPYEIEYAEISQEEYEQITLFDF